MCEYHHRETRRNFDDCISLRTREAQGKREISYEFANNLVHDFDLLGYWMVFRLLVSTPASSLLATGGVAVCVRGYRPQRQCVPPNTAFSERNGKARVQRTENIVHRWTSHFFALRIGAEGCRSTWTKISMRHFLLETQSYDAPACVPSHTVISESYRYVFLSLKYFEVVSECSPPNPDRKRPTKPNNPAG